LVVCKYALLGKLRLFVIVASVQEAPAEIVVVTCACVIITKKKKSRVIIQLGV